MPWSSYELSILGNLHTAFALISLLFGLLLIASGLSVLLADTKEQVRHALRPFWMLLGALFLSVLIWIITPDSYTLRNMQDRTEAAEAITGKQ